jgi:caffeoyl-CoA O-methyltransferase
MSISPTTGGGNARRRRIKIAVLCGGAVLAGLCLAASMFLLTPREPAPRPGTEAEKNILDTLDEVARSRGSNMNVPASDGRMLRILAEAIDARNVVEIGTSTGVSGLWFCLALEKTGGTLNTFELDRGRAATARRHFERAGVADHVNLIEGDAHKNVKALKGPIDIVFLDADKDGYVDYLNQLLPLVRPGGLVLAHNVRVIRDYLSEVSRNDGLETIYYTQGGGLAITVKKRRAPG